VATTRSWREAEEQLQEAIEELHRHQGNHDEQLEGGGGAAAGSHRGAMTSSWRESRCSMKCLRGGELTRIEKR